MREIVIISGKGGTGKTCISAAFATLGNDMVVADCDVDAANLHIVLQPKNYIDEKFVTGYKAVIDNKICTSCGLCADYCRFGAVEHKNGNFKIRETACDGCKLCARICPTGAIKLIESNKSKWYIGNYRNGKMVHARLSPGEENSGKLVSIVRAQAKRIAEEAGLGTILIDGPPGIGCPVISSVTGATDAVIVTEPTRSGFHDLKRLISMLSLHKAKLYVIINKYDLNLMMTDNIAEWCLAQKIPLIGKIAFDEEIVQALIHCKSICEWQPSSESAIEIKKIWETIKN
ncbi:MAG: ATP-binding protein [Bacteroidales bacterium]|nr:ATP-binding protein [Bacteroidales bacterium]